MLFINSNFSKCAPFIFTVMSLNFGQILAKFFTGTKLAQYKTFDHGYMSLHPITVPRQRSATHIQNSVEIGPVF